MVRVGIAIPVGPLPGHARYLAECLRSVMTQTRPPDQIVIVDDMHDLDARLGIDRDLAALVDDERVFIWRAPWRLGVAAAFNVGVALCDADAVVMLGADDILRPLAVEAVAACLERDGPGAPAYYWFDVEYSDGEEQSLPCNAAAPTKALWRLTGGFPPEAGAGAPDAALISVLLVHHPQALRRVDGGLLYWHRRHAEQETGRRGAQWHQPVIEIRNLLTKDYAPAGPWGRWTP